ncbi:unnamed protein product, partial [Prorocentrum cordatum]
RGLARARRTLPGGGVSAAVALLLRGIVSLQPALHVLHSCLRRTGLLHRRVRAGQEVLLPRGVPGRVQPARALGPAGLPHGARREGQDVGEDGPAEDVHDREIEACLQGPGHRQGGQDGHASAGHGARDWRAVSARAAATSHGRTAPRCSRGRGSGAT